MRMFAWWSVVSLVVHFARSESLARTWHADTRSPCDLMVDVVNDLGLNILKIHNENNENNIALSPYGVASILTALLEGVQGKAALEIQKCGGFPANRDVVRVGLRDIHRLLRSYFIPQEGFLSGLSLSSEKVTLKPEFQSILRFYGFDMTSFNTPIYPSIGTTTPMTNITTTDEITTTDNIPTTETTLPTTVTTTPQDETTKLPQQDETTTTQPETTLPVTTPPPTTIPTTITTIPTTITTIPTTITTIPTTITTIPTTITTIPTTTEMTTLETKMDTTTEIPTTSILTTLFPTTQNPTTTTYLTTNNNLITTTFSNDITTTEVPETTTLGKTDLTTTESLTTLTTTEPTETSTFRMNRVGRSIVDYFIARYHDGHSPEIYSHDGANKYSFLVNGKFQEPHAHFMTYETILPFFYVHNLNALALRFPLDSPKYYLLLILPVDEEGIDRLICDIGKIITLKQIVSHLRPTYVRAVIPSFMLRGFVILTSSLQKIGIRQIFEPRQADFSPMTDDKDIYVTNIEQAITVTIKNYMDPNMLNKNRNLHQYGPVEFKATHPFLYFVMDSEIDVTLVAGKIVNPINSRIQ